MDLSDYMTVPREAVFASKLIANNWTKLGKPTTPFSDSGKKMMNLIIKVWQELYPIDAATYMNVRKDTISSQKTSQEQVRQRTGRNLASYPYPIYQLMKKVFKGFDAAERKNCLKMIRLWPMFKLVERA